MTTKSKAKGAGNKKQQRDQLKLKKQTIRKLTEDDLKEVAGGVRAACIRTTS